MTLYLDTNVIVPLFVTDIHSDRAARFFADHDNDEKIISDFTRGEVGAVMSRLVRMAKLTIDQANNSLSLFDAWIDAKILASATETIDIRRAAAFVRRFELKLLLPDAVHLASCERHDLTLVTFDERLAASATAMGLPVLIPA